MLWPKIRNLQIYCKFWITFIVLYLIFWWTIAHKQNKLELYIFEFYHAFSIETFFFSKQNKSQHVKWFVCKNISFFSCFSLQRFFETFLHYSKIDLCAKNSIVMPIDTRISAKHKLLNWLWTKQFQMSKSITSAMK